MSGLDLLKEPARAAARALATTSSAKKRSAILAMADALEDAVATISRENRIDIDAAEARGAPPAVLDRLALTDDRIVQTAAGMRQIADLPDPIGEVIEERSLANGLRIRKIRVPMGIVGVIYEGRPNVTVDAAALAVQAGNAVLLRGSRVAERSNAALVDVLRSAGEQVGLPSGAIQSVPATRETASEMMRARGFLDLLIPRGGNDLIAAVVRESQVPVIETGVGNCHVYIDRDADLKKALRILVNAKVQRPGVCNAAETFLVHRGIAGRFLPEAVAALQEHGVTIYGDEEVRAASDGVEPAGEDEYRAEFLDLRIAGRVVGSVDEAIDHIARFGTRHTEAIITEHPGTARRFVDGVDAAAVMVNASTRFTDGFEFGMGAEIGISTQKLHARGPMALPELTSYKWVVEGDGQIRG